MGGFDRAHSEPHKCKKCKHDQIDKFRCVSLSKPKVHCEVCGEDFPDVKLYEYLSNSSDSYNRPKPERRSITKFILASIIILIFVGILVHSIIFPNLNSRNVENTDTSFTHESIVDGNNNIIGDDNIVGNNNIVGDGNIVGNNNTVGER
jgi:hypothetical protein